MRTDRDTPEHGDLPSGLPKPAQRALAPISSCKARRCAALGALT
jgi:hypothetical protein